MKQIKSLLKLPLAGVILIAMGFLGTVKADPLKVGFVDGNQFRKGPLICLEKLFVDFQDLHIILYPVCCLVVPSGN